MNPKKYKFLTEKYEKENKNLKLQEEFIALPGLKPVAGKFYAKHDNLVAQDAPAEYVAIVKKSISVTPKDNFDFPPPCSSMEYGWFAVPLIPRSKDRRLIFPITQCAFIKQEISIKEAQRVLPKVQFKGVPFRI